MRELAAECSNNAIYDQQNSVYGMLVDEDEMATRHGYYFWQVDERYDGKRGAKAAAIAGLSHNASQQAPNFTTATSSIAATTLDPMSAAGDTVDALLATIATPNSTTATPDSLPIAATSKRAIKAPPSATNNATYSAIAYTNAGRRAFMRQIWQKAVARQRADTDATTSSFASSDIIVSRNSHADVNGIDDDYHYDYDDDDHHHHHAAPNGVLTSSSSTAWPGLDMSAVGLRSLPPLPYPHLTHLYLAHNRLHTLPAALFTTLPALAVLDVSRNPLTCIPATIEHVAGTLRELLVVGCHLIALPPEIGRCWRLRALGMDMETIYAIAVQQPQLARACEVASEGVRERVKGANASTSNVDKWRAIAAAAVRYFRDTIPGMYACYSGWSSYARLCSLACLFDEQTRSANGATRAAMGFHCSYHCC